METIVMERVYEQPLDKPQIRETVVEKTDCAALYRVDWRESFLLSEDGLRQVCCFTAPDAESLRRVTEGDGSQEKSIWAGTLHDTAREGDPNVVVERRFDEPVTLESLQTIEDAAAWCLELHKVTFLRTYFSKDRRNMICLYRAPDAESVRLAQQQAGMPVTRVWACWRYTLDSLFGTAG